MTILTTEQQVLDLAGPGVVVLWRVDVPFPDKQGRKRLRTELYHRGPHGAVKWRRFDPADSFARDFTYENEALWAIAGRPRQLSKVSVADGTHRVASVEEFKELADRTVVRANDDIYQVFNGEWWRMDPWANPEEDTLSASQLWEWLGASEAGIVVIWEPSEAGV